MNELKNKRGGAPLNQHMHPRNQFRDAPPDFEELGARWPPLKPYLVRVHSGVNEKSARMGLPISDTTVDVTDREQNEVTTLQQKVERTEVDARDSHEAEVEYEVDDSDLELCNRDNRTTHKYTLDFKNRLAVRELLYALMHVHYGLKLAVPLDRLVPTVTSRENYIHWVADLIGYARYSYSTQNACSCVNTATEVGEMEGDFEHSTLAVYENSNTADEPEETRAIDRIDMQMNNTSKFNPHKRKHKGERGACMTMSNHIVDDGPRSASAPQLDLVRASQPVLGFDVGVGASCIYPLLGNALYGWNFGGSDINDVSLQYARENVHLNALNEHIQLVHTKDAEHVLCGALEPRYIYDFVMCNPPFFADAHESQTGGVAKQRKPNAICTGADNEMQTDGGEVGFVGKMIEDSLRLGGRVRWYTSMLGKKSSLDPLLNKLKDLGVQRFNHTVFNQGRTVRWAIAWSLIPDVGNADTVYAGVRESPRACVRCATVAPPQLSVIPSARHESSQKRMKHDVPPDLAEAATHTPDNAQGSKLHSIPPTPLHRTTAVVPSARIYTVALHCGRSFTQSPDDVASPHSESAPEQTYRTLVRECVLETLLDFEVHVTKRSNTQLQSKIEWFAYRNTWSRKYRRDKSRRTQAAGVCGKAEFVSSLSNQNASQVDHKQIEKNLDTKQASTQGDLEGGIHQPLTPIFNVTTTMLPICDCVLLYSREEYGRKLGCATEESTCTCQPGQLQDMRVICEMQDGDALMWKAFLVHFQRGLLLRHERMCKPPIL